MTDQEPLSVIIVNYNAGRHLAACIQSLMTNTPAVPMEIIIVDNASMDDSITRVRQAFPEVKILTNPENVGFAVACNQGIKRARGLNILLLNPDTIVLPYAVKDSLAFLSQNPEAGIVGCRLLDNDGQPRNSCRTFPTAWDYLFDSLFLTKLFPRSKLFGRFYLTNTTFNEPSEVDVVQGAFFLFKRQVMDDIGLLDERFFMYAEERDFCYRAKAAGWKVYFYPQAAIVHVGSICTRQQAPEMFIEQHKSTLIFHLKHDTLRDVAVIKVYLFLGVAIRLFIWTLLSIMRRRPGERSRQSIYLAVTRWYLARGIHLGFPR
ncbi:N-acetylglucosaminyl-diphospho-decaprenol L-rhamnosyltransferase [subsurface metagenome]|nr:glycosyltransferase [Dehalococcoidia bacterium]